MYWKNLSTKNLHSLSRETPIILPIAAIEQHGDHLPVGTDALINEHFCQKLEERIGSTILICPNIQLGCSSHHLDFTGTLSFSHETMLAAIGDIIASLATHGFKRILLLNSHGGNQGISQVAVEKFGTQHPDMHITAVSWFKLATEKLRPLNESGFQGVGHACEFETSLILASYPETVVKEEIKDTPMPSYPKPFNGDLLQAPAVSYHRTMRQWTGDGVFGKPSYASAEKGEQITAIIVEALSELLQEISKL